MTNRISDYLPEHPHPLDRPDLVDRQRVLRVVSLGLILITVFVVTGISLVVRFALGGRAIAQNGALLGGIPILTVIGAVLTLSAVAVAVLMVPLLTKAGLRRIATEPPPPPEPGAPPDTEADRLWKLYAQGKFLEYGLAEGAAVVTAVLFHLSADWLMIGFVFGMVAFMIVRFPTHARVRAWFDEAVPQLEAEKRSATDRSEP